MPGEKLYLRLENAGVDVKINGETVFSFLESANYTGYAWQSFGTEGLNESDFVEIEVDSYYKDGSRAAQILIESLYAGDGSGFLTLASSKFGVTGVVAFIALFVGFIYIAEGLLSFKITAKAAERIFLYGIYCFLGAVWALSDSLYPYFSFFIKPSWLAGLIDMLGMTLFPIALAALIRFGITDTYLRKVMSAALYSALAVAAVLIALHTAGVCDLAQQQFLIVAALLIQLATGLYCIFKNFFSEKLPQLTFMLIAVAPILIAVIIDAVNLAFNFSPERTYMRYGLCLSFFILT